MDYDAYDAILHHIFKQTQGDAWFKPAEENVATGVCVRVQPGLFRVFPYENPALEPFEVAVRTLNPEVAVKTRSASIHAALALIGPNDTQFIVDAKNTIQVLDTMLELAHAEKGQCAAFIRDERVLIVWADRLDDIIPSVLDIESRLLKLVWKERVGSTNSRPTSVRGLPTGSPRLPGTPQRIGTPVGGSASRFSYIQGAGWSLKDSIGLGLGSEAESEKAVGAMTKEKDGSDVEGGKEGQTGREARPTRLFAPLYIGIATALAIFFMSSGISILIQEWLQDGDYTHFALAATAPLIFCVSLFFTIQLTNTLSYIIGPIAQYHENSKFYSAIPPSPTIHLPTLPHITIQMPVYKESLTQTITPSVVSLKKAMLTYARQGGTSSIFVNDDGLQLLAEEDRNERIEFYATHGIGWVARPPHSEETPRAGRFKKASNMNYALALSLRMEEILLEFNTDSSKIPLSILADEEAANANGVMTGGKWVPPPNPFATLGNRSAGSTPTISGSPTDPFADDIIGGLDLDLEEKALARAVLDTKRTWDLSGRAVGSGKSKASDPEASPSASPQPKVKTTQAWAAGGKAMRIGEIILLVDSDTEVPEDCFRDAAREFAECPEVAIIQHESDVMQVAHHYFENAIAYFTRRINRCISIAVANGEVAPFVGHNAFLRWKAVQDAGFADTDDVKRFWSENNVSEDFDLALRLLLRGFIVRWATYSKGGFKEGVSLTCDDELNRWQKYAYGCNELIFNPLYQWLYRGPVNKQLHTFLWSKAPMHYKISMMSYMFSYYGIAAAMFLSVLNYVLLGLTFHVDGYFLRSWEIWLACTVVFPGAGNIGMTVLEYRLGVNSLLGGLYENLKWVPFFFFFFGGLSLHLAGAVLAHLFSFNITWSATKKEVEISNFFKEVPKILKRFWLSWAICWALVAGMIILSTSLVPLAWQIDGTAWAVIFPLALQVGCHILFPIVLNPWLMIFSY